MKEFLIQIGEENMPFGAENLWYGSVRPHKQEETDNHDHKLTELDKDLLSMCEIRDCNSRMYAIVKVNEKSHMICEFHYKSLGFDKNKVDK